MFDFGLLIFKFNASVPLLNFTIQLSSFHYFEQATYIFRAQGLEVPKIQQGADDDRYHFSFNAWKDIFIALCIHAANFPPRFPFHYDEKELAENIFIAWQHLSVIERELCVKHWQDFQDREFLRNSNYRKITQILASIGKILGYTEIAEFVGVENIESLLQQNKDLFDFNNKFYDELIASARSLSDEANKISAQLMFHGVQAKLSINSNKEFLFLKEFSYPLYVEVGLKQAEELLKKINLIYNDLAINKKLILTHPLQQELSEADFLCYQFNSETSPITSLIHDKELDIGLKLAVMGKLVKMASFKTKKLNINISSGFMDVFPAIDSTFLGAPDELPPPLAHAIEHGNTDMIRLLIVSGAALNIIFQHSYMKEEQYLVTQIAVLHLAVKQDHKEAVRLLLENGVNANALAFANHTPLFFARSEEVAKLLIDAGADPTHIDDYGDTALHLILSNGKKNLSYQSDEERFQLFEFLLSHSKKVINHQNHKGQTLLYQICRRFQAIPFAVCYQYFKLVLEAGADLNVLARENDSSTKFTTTPLHRFFEQAQYYSIAQNKELIKLFLDYKPDISIRNEFGRTVVHQVIDQGWDDELVLLLEFAQRNKMDIIHSQTENSPLFSHSILYRLCVAKIELRKKQAMATLEVLFKYDFDPFLESFFVIPGYPSRRISGTLIECLNNLHQEKYLSDDYFSQLLEKIESYTARFLDKKYNKLEDQIREIRHKIVSENINDLQAQEDFYFDLSNTLSELYGEAEDLFKKLPRANFLMLQINALVIRQDVFSSHFDDVPRMYKTIATLHQNTNEGKVDVPSSFIFHEIAELYYEFANKCYGLINFNPEKSKILYAIIYKLCSLYFNYSKEREAEVNNMRQGVLLALMDLKMDYMSVSEEKLARDFPLEFAKAQQDIRDQFDWLTENKIENKMDVESNPLPSVNNHATIFKHPTNNTSMQLDTNNQNAEQSICLIQNKQ